MLLKSFPACFQLCVRYHWQVKAYNLPLRHCVLGRRLLSLLFTYFRRGMYSQATPRLLNACVTS